MVCLLSNRKKRTCGINSFLIEGGQPSFYTENIPFSSSTIFSSSPTPKLVSCCASPRLKTFVSDAFRQDLNNHTKMPHPGQSHNVVIHVHQHVGSPNVKHDSQSGGYEFDLPNRPFLFPWSHFTRLTYSCMLWAAECVISLTTIFIITKKVYHYD